MGTANLRGEKKKKKQAQSFEAAKNEPLITAHLSHLHSESFALEPRWKQSLNIAGEKISSLHSPNCTLIGSSHRADGAYI